MRPKLLLAAVGLLVLLLAARSVLVVAPGEVVVPVLFGAVRPVAYGEGACTSPTRSRATRG